MIRRTLQIFIVFLLSIMTGVTLRAQELDARTAEMLSSKLDEYFLAIEREGNDVQIGECDFLIESAADSLTRQFIALKAYDHYLKSPVMGSEAVAIHILDKWFIPGTIKMKNDFELLNARVFADFNRQSLLGMKAPSLHMRTPEGKDVLLFSGNDPDSAADLPPGVLKDDCSRFSILYFYDADCSKCKLESMLLRTVLEDGNYPVRLCAIYAGDDRKAWEEYISERLSIGSDALETVHLWDPEVDSDFQRKYGVLQTPRMFLVRPDGVIIGRGLDAEALLQMLRPIFTPVDLTYGSQESSGLFDSIFASEDGSIDPSVAQVRKLADYVKETTLPKGDTLTFRQLSGDLLYYLASRSGEGFKEGLKYLIDNNIKAYPKAWATKDDSLKVLGFADIMDDLLSKSTPGTLISDIKVQGERIVKGKTKKGSFALRKLRSDSNIVVFFTEGCEVCKAEKAALKELSVQDKKLQLLFVNVDEIMSADPEKAERLFESFDLSSLPYIVRTDRKGIIDGRYLSYR